MKTQPKYPCRLKAISPTALHTFENDSNAFVLNYVLKAKRPKQLKVMSIGSAFDSRCKAYLTAELCQGNEQELFRQLFEDSVEPHNRDWAMRESEQLFEWYKQTGALANLVIELTGFQVTPQFEFSVNRTLIEKAVNDTTMAIPLTGKPDCYFTNNEGAKVILDWKVNGYCSKASPLAGYIRCRDLTGFNKGMYKGSIAIRYKGIDLNCSTPLKMEWNTQLIIYSWLLGSGIVSFEPNDWILGIEQLACNLKAPNPKNKLRVASFRIGRETKAAKEVWMRLARMWEAIQHGHYFIKLTQEESDHRTETIMTGGDDVAWMLGR